ncbi:MAG: MBL fold metallo-hydrolase [Hyphomicrobium sp.]|nr:MBL fold metallo-hydrolase [Hyphomicrobium sp.]
MSLRITILGCGSSGGVPRIGALWGQCDPNNPKNRRTRCALLVEDIRPGAKTVALIDTPPDIREQLLSVRADHLDGVLFTHDHADHTHGIDDLRGIAYAMKRRVDCWFDRPTRESLTGRFSYCFTQKPGSDYHPILNAHDIAPDGVVRLGGSRSSLTFQTIVQRHGEINSLGFRVGDVAYSPDVSDIPESSLALLEGLDLWIVDALRHTRHPSHFSVAEALQWIERIKPRRAILTHMTAELDYERLKRELPPHIEPAYDGMVIEF